LIPVFILDEHGMLMHPTDKPQTGKE